MFEKWWPDLEAEISASLKESETTAEPRRSPDEMLAELLEITRNVKCADMTEEYQKLRKLLSLPIEEMELPEKSVSMLRKAKIYTVGQLASNTESELVRNCGHMGLMRLNDIKEKLAQLGLILGMSFEDGLLKP